MAVYVMANTECEYTKFYMECEIEDNTIVIEAPARCISINEDNRFYEIADYLVCAINYYDLTSKGINAAIDEYEENNIPFTSDTRAAIFDAFLSYDPREPEDTKARIMSIISGDVWKCRPIRGCSQGAYAALYYQDGVDVDYIEAVYFGTGVEISWIEADELPDYNTFKYKCEYNYIAWSPDIIPAIAECIGCKPEEVTIIKDEPIITHVLKEV